jgi:hypothetical protein
VLFALEDLDLECSEVEFSCVKAKLLIVGEEGFLSARFIFGFAADD